MRISFACRYFGHDTSGLLNTFRLWCPFEVFCDVLARTHACLNLSSSRATLKLHARLHVQRLAASPQSRP